MSHPRGAASTPIRCAYRLNRCSAERYRALRDASPDGLLVIDDSLRVIEVNAQYCALTGYAESEVLGRAVYDLDPNFTRESAEAFGVRIREAGGAVFETCHRRRDGSSVPLEASVGYSRLYGGCSFCFFRDVTERLHERERLQFLAYRDELTGLPNRRQLVEDLKRDLALARRQGHGVAVCYLDLDGFGVLNAEHGDDWGDRLLQQVAGALQGQLRGTDRVARVSGDEFVVVFNGTEGGPSLQQSVRRILDEIAATDIVERRLTSCCGVSHYPGDAESAETLLRNALHALYHAKQQGPDCCLCFDAAEHRGEREQHSVRQEFRDALRRDQLRLYPQPRVDLHSGAIVSAEVLLRWEHPQRGLLGPAAFIPQLRGTELEVALDLWVLDQSLRLLQAQPASARLPLSVNISSQTIQRPRFVAELREALDRHGGDLNGLLEFELLETSALGDTEHVAEIMAHCRDLGVIFALDDFGTGYASLTYFHRLPVEILKIDQNFVRNMLRHRQDHDIVEGVVLLAKAVGRDVVAEGVESPEIAMLLYLMDCRLAQGYAIARPMPAAALQVWHRAWSEQNFCSELVETISNSAEPALAVALFAHQRWYRTFREAVMAGALDAATVRDSGGCQLGHWLEGVGRKAWVDSPGFTEALMLHSRLHERAAQLVVSSREGRAPISPPPSATSTSSACVLGRHCARWHRVAALPGELVEAGGGRGTRAVGPPPGVAHRPTPGAAGLAAA